MDYILRDIDVNLWGQGKQKAKVVCNSNGDPPPPVRRMARRKGEDFAVGGKAGVGKGPGDQILAVPTNIGQKTSSAPVIPYEFM